MSDLNIEPSANASSEALPLELIDVAQGMSQWQLMRIHFKRNQLAVVSLWVVVILYLVVIFADFLSPYASNKMNEAYVTAPPMRVHIWDDDGLSRPFVYNYTSEVDRETFQRVFKVDESTKYPIRLFVKGADYKILGILPSNIHLFGVDEPGVVFLLGTDRFGQDMFSRVLAGTQISMTIGLLSVLISMVIGSVLGTISGYYGGVIDSLIQRIIELLSSLPRIPLWMTLAAALPPSWSSLMVYFGIVTILALIGWTGLAREVRGKVLTIRNMDYTMASKASGASGWYNILHHMIPNSLSHIIIITTLAIPGMIIVESSLSFLGLGIQPPMTSLGVLLREAQNVRSIVNYPWLFSPAYVIIVSILAFNFFGDGLRDAADPYSN